jgi:hypothetical protein
MSRDEHAVCWCFRACFGVAAASCWRKETRGRRSKSRKKDLIGRGAVKREEVHPNPRECLQGGCSTEEASDAGQQRDLSSDSWKEVGAAQPWAYRLRRASKEATATGPPGFNHWSFLGLDKPNYYKLRPSEFRDQLFFADPFFPPPPDFTSVIGKQNSKAHRVWANFHKERDLGAALATH